MFVSSGKAEFLSRKGVYYDTEDEKEAGKPIQRTIAPP